MAHYDSLKSLGENTLNRDDTVELLGTNYQVKWAFLHNISGGDNNDIFEQLGIKNPRAFCEIYYGYLPKIGTWPEFMEDDFSAATRVVKALFERIEAVKNAKALEESEEIEEATTDEPLKEESKSSVLLPSKHRSIKQVVIQKEITLNNL